MSKSKSRRNKKEKEKDATATTSTSTSTNISSKQNQSSTSKSTNHANRRTNTNTNTNNMNEYEHEYSNPFSEWAADVRTRIVNNLYAVLSAFIALTDFVNANVNWNSREQQLRSQLQSNNGNGTSTSTSTDSDSNSDTTEAMYNLNLISICRFCGWIVFTHYYLLVAFKIRLLSISDYGTVIHEFDPYFNLRAAEYLYERGWRDFMCWYDGMSWYPIGRPVGTTIYPGMQFVAVFIKRYIVGEDYIDYGYGNNGDDADYGNGKNGDSYHRYGETTNGDGDGNGNRMSLNDVCCFIPAWFGVLASIITGMIAYECSLGGYCTSTNTRSARARTRTRKKKKNQNVISFLKNRGLLSGHFVRMNMNMNMNMGVNKARRRIRKGNMKSNKLQSQPTTGTVSQTQSQIQTTTTTTTPTPTMTMTTQQQKQKEKQNQKLQKQKRQRKQRQYEHEHEQTARFYNAIECGIFSMGMMGMCPAHLMRSIGGGFDNESVAIAPMLLTFYFWVRSLRDDGVFSGASGASGGGECGGGECGGDIHTHDSDHGDHSDGEQFWCEDDEFIDNCEWNSNNAEDHEDCEHGYGHGNGNGNGHIDGYETTITGNENSDNNDKYKYNSNSDSNSNCYHHYENEQIQYRWGILAGISYFCMASCWGGYIFLVNLIAIHATVLVLMGRFTKKAYISYSLFYVVGTVLVIQVPVIGYAPLRSLEQVGALLVFVVYQVIMFGEWRLSASVKQKLKLKLKQKQMSVSAKARLDGRKDIKNKKNNASEGGNGGKDRLPTNANVRVQSQSNSRSQSPLKNSRAKNGSGNSNNRSSNSNSNSNSNNNSSTNSSRDYKKRIRDANKYRIKVYTCALIVAIIFITVFVPTSYFGPLSARVRGVFIKHAKTGNPLVDSVAEHQPADSHAYFRFLQHLCTGGPIGFLLVLFHFGDASSFLITYAITAYFLSHRMVRLLLLMGPIASILSGITVGRIVSHVLGEMDAAEDEHQLLQKQQQLLQQLALLEAENKRYHNHREKQVKGGDGNSNGNNNVSTPVRRKKKSHKRKASSLYSYEKESSNFVAFKCVFYFIMLSVVMLFLTSYQNYCISLCRSLSNPTIVEMRQTVDGRIVKVDDYREAYWWLRDNTPEDSRILAWWDYGYQITSIANRTTMADGNTWNHEHIALLGRILTSKEKEGYEIARHLSDYVLVWAGGGGDDLAKSPHVARIANSVYRSVCPNDLTCNSFSFVDRYRTPSKAMSESMLYKMHSHEMLEGVNVNSKYFKEVYQSKYGKVRIFQVLNVDRESKAWIADPRHRMCDDPPGHWVCRGQYPPALKGILAEKTDFNQRDEHYQAQYFESLEYPSYSVPGEDISSGYDDYDIDINIEQVDSDLKSIETNNRDDENDIELMLEEMQDAEAVFGTSAADSKIPTDKAINNFSTNWIDTAYTTKMWNMITNKDRKAEDLEAWLNSAPLLAHMRSSDGRGPMFWAFEHRRHDMVQVLTGFGVGHSDQDKDGLTPVDLLDSQQ